MISVEITGIKLLPKIREFNDVFQETPESAEPTGATSTRDAAITMHSLYAIRPWTYLRHAIEMPYIVTLKVQTNFVIKWILQ